LRYQTSQIYYFKQKVDFYCLEQPQLINISYDVSSPETKKREIKGLQEGMSYFKLSEAFLITQDQEESLKIDGQTIKIKPLWKWLLES
jgi:hypothetical protein